MCGLVALVRGQLAWLDLARRAGFSGVDVLGSGLGIAFGGQSGDGHFNEIGITEIFRAVGIGDFHGLGEQMQPVRIGGCRLGQIQGFQHVENLDHMHPAR